MFVANDDGNASAALRGNYPSEGCRNISVFICYRHCEVLSKKSAVVLSMHEQTETHNQNQDETLLCRLQMTVGFFVQPYEGWWVSYTMTNHDNLF